MNDRTIQVVCADLDLLRRYRSELERNGETYDFRLAISPSEARRSSRKCEPVVILLDDSALTAISRKSGIDFAVASLTEIAPVVVVAAIEREPELEFLITAGAVDFVARRGRFLTLAADMVLRRLRMADCAAASSFSAEDNSGDFGEILRHEVNNPLTGILGNAELLLARREGLSEAAIERVETIAELAIRLRETVRRLSRAWDGRPDSIRSA